MSFGTQLKEYRDEYLHISQKQMAEDLGVDGATMSRYESDIRGFPIDLVPQIKELYDIPDDVLMAMILGKPLKTLRPFSNQTLDSTAAYEKGFLAQYGPWIEGEPLLKEFILRMHSFEPENRQLVLSGVLDLLQAFEKRHGN